MKFRTSKFSFFSATILARATTDCLCGIAAATKKHFSSVDLTPWKFSQFRPSGTQLSAAPAIFGHLPCYERHVSENARLAQQISRSDDGQAAPDTRFWWPPKRTQSQQPTMIHLPDWTKPWFCSFFLSSCFRMICIREFMVRFVKTVFRFSHPMNLCFSQIVGSI